MSINDITTELEELKSKSSTKIQNDKTVNDIINNNIKHMEDFVNNRVINIYARPWNKLEPKLKKVKLLEFFNNELTEKIIDKKNYNKILINITKHLDLSKKVKLEYDIETCKITKFNYKDFL